MFSAGSSLGGGGALREKLKSLAGENLAGKCFCGTRCVLDFEFPKIPVEVDETDQPLQRGRLKRRCEGSKSAQEGSQQRWGSRLPLLHVLSVDCGGSGAGVQNLLRMRMLGARRRIFMSVCSSVRQAARDLMAAHSSICRCCTTTHLETRRNRQPWHHLNRTEQRRLLSSSAPIMKPENNEDTEQNAGTTRTKKLCSACGKESDTLKKCTACKCVQGVPEQTPQGAQT